MPRWKKRQRTYGSHGQRRQKRAKSDTEEPQPPSSPASPDNIDEQDEIKPEPVQTGRTDQKVLVLHAPNGLYLSAGFFDPEEGKIRILEETKDTWGWDLASLLLEQLEPTKVFLSSNSAEALIEKMTNWCEEKGLDIDDTLNIKQSRFFQIRHAQYALTSLRLPQKNGNFDPWQDRKQTPEAESDVWNPHNDNGRDAGMGKVRMALVKLGCRVNMDSPNTICVMGALVHFVKGLATGDDRLILDVSGVEVLALDQHMLINQDALASLAIIDTESHAFSHNRPEKISLSLFGLLNTCVTHLGKKLLLAWFLRPLTNIREISYRHESIDRLNYPANQYAVEAIKRSMKGIGNLGHHCAKIRKSRGTWRDWQKVVEAMGKAMHIAEKVHEIGFETRLPIVSRIGEAINNDINLFLNFVTQIIDFDQSSILDRICVRPGIDEELDQWQADYAGMGTLLGEIADSRLQPIVMQYQLGLKVDAIYFPQLGHLAVLHGRDMRNQIPPFLGWDLAFFADGKHYYKTNEMRDLDEFYGDPHAKIIDREVQYADRLAEGMKRVDRVLLDAVDAIAELDCLIALAAAARQYCLVKPLMSEEPVLEIRDGRHLLHEQLVENYVCNDTVIHGGFEQKEKGLRSMMVVTGANGSGKSAYGKQVALIAFMAQIGSFVPATEATIGIVDKIFTRVQTRESSSKPASAFMIDLAQVSLALRGATSRSLVILDEFGKGTTPADGAGLLTGVIEYLIDNARPRTIVLTHFHELFTNSFLSEDLPILLAHMKTIMPDAYGDQMTFLYKLSPTVCLTSSAAECALLHGIPPAIVDRARYITECVSKFELSKVFDTGLSIEQAEELRLAEEIMKTFLQWDLSQDTVDVAMQITDLLDDVEARVKAMKLDEQAQQQPSSDELAPEGGTIEAIADQDDEQYEEQEREANPEADGDGSDDSSVVFIREEEAPPELADEYLEDEEDEEEVRFVKPEPLE